MKHLTAALLLAALTLTAVSLAFPPVWGGLQLLAVMFVFAGTFTGCRALDQEERA